MPTRGSQTQQVNTHTGSPDQKSDLPLESDKSTNSYHKVQIRWNRPKGRIFHFTPVDQFQPSVSRLEGASITKMTRFLDLFKISTN